MRKMIARSKPLGPRTRLMMLVLELVAIGASAYLLWIALSEGVSPIGCDGAASLDCDHVLGSRWSLWLGVPVSLLSLIVYLGILVATLLIGIRRAVGVHRHAWSALVGLTTIAAGAAAWFLVLQFAVLQALCPFCLIVHACGLVLAGLVMVHRPPVPKVQTADSTAPASRSGVMPMTMGLIAVAVMIAGHLLVEPKTYVVETFEQPVSKHTVYRPVDTPGLTPDPSDDLSSDDLSSDDLSNDDAPGSADFVALEEPSDGASELRIDVHASDTHTSDVHTSGTPTIRNDLGTGRAEAHGQVQVRPAETVTILGGRQELRWDEHLMIGSPNAEHVLVKVFDYTCPACRRMHQRMEEALKHYGDSLAIILIPAPLNTGCNSAISGTSQTHAYACLYARLALVVWKHNIEAFPEFHAWIFESRKPPEPGIVRRRVSKLIGNRLLFDVVSEPWVEQHLQTCVGIFKLCKGGSIPKLIMGDTIVSGKDIDTDELYELLEEHLGIEPPPSP